VQSYTIKRRKANKERNCGDHKPNQATTDAGPIPAREGLSTFVPAGSENDPVIAEMQHRVGASRWFPVQGGHKVLMRFDRGPYDSSRFTIESASWDHEHCDSCNDCIPAMTLCYVTQPGERYVLLCAKCYERHVASAAKFHNLKKDREK
jgi:hypothetical protein